MSYPWDPPAGNAGDIQTAAKALGQVATDLSTQVTKAKAAASEASSEWHAPRAEDFKNASQALVDELGMAMTAIGQTANLLGQWSTALQTATTNIAGWKQKYDAVANPTPAKPVTDATSAAHEEIYYEQQATAEHTNLKKIAGQIAAAIDEQTGLAVPKSSGLSPAEIARRVDASFGMDDFTRGEYYTGQISDDAIWGMLHTADGPVFDSGVPAPGDPNFQAWYAKLTPAQQLLETQKLATSFNGKDFKPYQTIKGGSMPPWAYQFNAEHQNFCTVDGKMGDGYGYFGGGTIMGPGGKQWPIVMPYYNDGKNTYMDDDDGPAPNGGITQLDGKDPGWHTVYTWTGADQYGSVSTGTKLATAFLIGTGQELETTETDPDAVHIGPDGKPYAGNDAKSMPSGPQDKAWWDVTSKTMFPENEPTSDPRVKALQPNLEWQEPALGANALLVQAGQAAVAVHNEDSHATRQYYVDYQVNDDGRVRAVVHTYSATPTEDGKTYVGSFANTFPTGQSGNSSEIPYKTRHNPYPKGQYYLSAQPDPNVEYSNDGDEEINNNQPIQEKLNK